jgi:hypothetical protein
MKICAGIVNQAALLACVWCMLLLSACNGEEDGQRDKDATQEGGSLPSVWRRGPGFVLGRNTLRFLFVEGEGHWEIRLAPMPKWYVCGVYGTANHELYVVGLTDWEVEARIVCLYMGPSDANTLVKSSWHVKHRDGTAKLRVLEYNVLRVPEEVRKERDFLGQPCSEHACIVLFAGPGGLRHYQSPVVVGTDGTRWQVEVDAGHWKPRKAVS